MSDDTENNTGNTAELQIQVPQEVQRGNYANQLIVTHTAEEFILDFVLATPPAGLVNSRVLISPGHAKRVVATLQDAIQRYEAAFGTIEVKQAMFTPESNQRH